MQDKIYYAFLDSPIGRITIASSKLGIVFVDIGTKNPSKKLKRKLREIRPVKSEKANRKALNELESYFKGNLKIFKSKLALRGSPFQLKVWNNTKKIPYGRTRSYKFIASKTGKSNSSRAVGNAMAQNPVPLFIPCHRIIKSDGHLGNYGPGQHIKRKLLKLEEAI